MKEYEKPELVKVDGLQTVTAQPPNDLYSGPIGTPDPN